MLDEAFGVLSRPLQRRVLLAVATYDEPIKLDTLGDETIMDEHRWKEHQIALHHIHLPQLADMGFIHWNPEEQIVDEGEQFDEIRPLLDVIDNKIADDSDRFSTSSLGIMIAGILV